MSHRIPSRLLPQRVTIKPLTGVGAYGNTYGPPVVLPARVDMTRKVVRSTTGVEVVAEATVVLPPGTVCPPDSLVTMPGEDRERATLTYSPVVGARDVHHVEVTTK